MMEQAQKTKWRVWEAFTLLTGIILPALSVLVESVTHICAEHFFDPIPTLWHLLLVAFVPLAHLQVWLAVNKGRTERGMLLGIANAIAIGISIFYTIVYIPLLPLAAMALALIGLGLLPMAPIFSLISGIILRRRLGRIVPLGFSVKLTGLAAGLALAFAAIGLAEVPATLTRMGLQMAASKSPERRARGLRWLRATGDRDYMLRACYERSGRATDLLGFLLSLEDPVTAEEARQIYYKVTGETFNTRIPPKRLNGRWEPQDSFDFDPEQGGEVIAGKVKKLTLAGSRMDGSIDADAGLGYIEWTLQFKNDSAMQQEARAQVQLPPGGVVSRLTLWVNGEEREAAFAGRTQVRQAYQQIVRQRRDPVLVTTAGQDRILVQCFPVPPNGGEMKIRFGITTPLVLENRAEGLLRLPHLLERNFGIPEDIKHAVWIESENPLLTESNGLHSEQPRANLHAVRGVLRDEELSESGALLRATRTSEITEAWTPDPLKGKGQITRQFIREREIPTPSRIVLVVDTSRRLRPRAQEISAALRTLPPDVELKLLLADGSGVYEEGANHHAASASHEETGRQIEKVSFEGGADNVPALMKAWDIAADNPQSAIIWVHGPQPILLHAVEGLRQRWERRPNSPTLYAVQTEIGSDRIMEKLDGLRAFESVPRLGSLQTDLEKLFAQLTGRRKPLEFVRESEQLEQKPVSPILKETSVHLSKLWANDEIKRLIGSQEKNKAEDAVKLATGYQLVTPVSGAVVLETQAQYTQAGLQPVDPSTVPTIPEPETVLLILVVAFIFLWMLYRQRLVRRRTT
ncbi:MAG TPA: VIT domain-containing protein [Pyrinomonadaceae bacterium]|jgi:hypothetical protein